MAFFESSGIFSASTLPDELIVTMPGDITNVYFDYFDMGLGSYFIINEKTNKSAFEISGNKVIFKIKDTRNKTKGIDFEKKIEARCGTDDKSDEVKGCTEREFKILAAELSEKISKRFDQDIKKPGFGFSITTRINKISKFFK